MSSSPIERAVKAVGPGKLWSSLTPEQQEDLVTNWEAFARPEQLEPPGNWRVWFLMAGRGFGKTRTGAETCRKWAMDMPGSHGAMVAPTAADVRDVMVKAILSPWDGGKLIEYPSYEPSKRLISFKNGSTITTYSADEPERLRGPQHHWGWADEPGSWRYPDAWDQLQFGLRLGSRARVIVTGTPRATDMIKGIVHSPATVITRGSTMDNLAHLDAFSVGELRRQHDGTRIGRQELYGELLEDIEGALWSHGLIDRARRDSPSTLRRIVVGVDPSGSAKKTADEAGIVVAGIGECHCLGRDDVHAFVLEDLTGRYSPRDMGTKAINAYHRWKASRLVAEDNFGGKIIEDLVGLIDNTVAYKAVHASRGKIVRAEPVAALYEQGRVHHVGLHKELEDELCSYAPLVSTESPGRLDALVWALTELMLGEPVASFGNSAFTSPQFTFGNTEQDFDKFLQGK